MTFSRNFIENCDDIFGEKVEEGIQCLKDIIWDKLVKMNVIDIDVDCNFATENMRKLNIELDVHILSPEDLEDVIINSQTDLVKMIGELEV